MAELMREFQEKAKNAQSAEELVEFAKENNFSLTLEQATEYMNTLHQAAGLMAKAKEAKSIEELMELAKANDLPLTTKQATEYMNMLHHKTGEIADDELENVSGGGCDENDPRNRYPNKELLLCRAYKCQRCGTSVCKPICWKCSNDMSCNTCVYEWHDNRVGRKCLHHYLPNY